MKMNLSAALVGLLCCCAVPANALGPMSVAPWGVEQAQESILQQLLRASRERDGQRFDAACCKVCRKGKACGNSCINRSYTCHKGKGCACNG